MGIRNQRPTTLVAAKYNLHTARRIILQQVERELHSPERTKRRLRSPPKIRGHMLLLEKAFPNSWRTLGLPKRAMVEITCQQMAVTSRGRDRVRSVVNRGPVPFAVMRDYM